ncbi:MAG: CDC27 family protein [Acidobacteriota bacterium]
MKKKPFPKKGEEVLHLWEKAIKAFYQKEYEKAKMLFKEFNEKFFSEKEMVARSNSYISICDNFLGKKENTLKKYEDIFLYGVYKLNKGETKEAIKLFNRALEKMPKDPTCYYIMSLCYAKNSDYKNSIEFLKKATIRDDYFKALAINEPDFEPLHNLKEFQEITQL